MKIVKWKKENGLRERKIERRSTKHFSGFIFPEQFSSFYGTFF